MKRILLAAFVLSWPAAAFAQEKALTPEASEFFEKKVRPVLVQHCYECHSATAKKLYLHASGMLSFDAPKANEAAFDEYVSDPAHPVPYRPRPIEQTYDPRGSNWRGSPVIS